MVVDRETELALVRRLRAGEEGAFEQAYRAWRPRVFSFLARLSRSRDEAEDLSAETWLRLAAHARRLAPDTRLGPWLFTVARNLYASACRSRGLDAATGLIDIWPRAAPRPSPFEQAAGSELERQVEAALAALPAADRELLLLIGVEGFTPREAAAICDLPGDTVRKRLSRARVRLGRLLADARRAPTMAMGEPR